jgi:ribose 5-phosphate isomerase B
MKIALGADHAGFPLKEHLAAFVRDLGHEVRDLGTSSGDSVDYADFAVSVGRSVAAGESDRGILVCGTGVGVAMAANKLPRIRAANCNDLFTAKLARAHNDANVLTLGGRVVGEGLAEDIVRTFLDTEWEDGRHRRRVEKIHALE